MTRNLAREMWKRLLALTFLSSETAASTAVLTLGSAGRKEEEINSQKKRRTCSADLFTDSLRYVSQWSQQ